MEFKVTNQGKPVQKYEWGDKSRTLAADGALEHDVWDRLSASNSPDHRDQFVKSLYDDRLLSEEPASAASLGPNWKPADSQGRLFVLGDPKGPHQQLDFGPSGRSGGDFTVKTCLPGELEHQMSGQSSFGQLGELITEKIIVF